MGVTIVCFYCRVNMSDKIVTYRTAVAQSYALSGTRKEWSYQDSSVTKGVFNPLFDAL